MLFTKKGDKGETSAFGYCNQKLSKSSAIIEALGCLDEINSFLGICKVLSKKEKVKSLKSKVQSKLDISEIINRIQNDIFVIQAQVAGADKKIKDDEVKYVEEIINNIEKELPPIKTFLISGANEMSANFDFARTLARRAERRVVSVNEEGMVKITPETLAFMNRLSSLLYAFARYYAKTSGAEERSPNYK